MFIRAIAIIAPGMFLSQPPMATTPSIDCALQAVSIESAITSRETSEYFIPSVPIAIPSLTVIVPNICGIAPAPRTAVSARLRQRVEAHVAGRDRAVTVGDADDRLVEVAVGNPTARSIERLGARWTPSVTSLLRRFSAIGVSPWTKRNLRRPGIGSAERTGVYRRYVADWKPRAAARRWPSKASSSATLAPGRPSSAGV